MLSERSRIVDRGKIANELDVVRQVTVRGHFVLVNVVRQLERWDVDCILAIELLDVSAEEQGEGRKGSEKMSAAVHGRKNTIGLTCSLGGDPTNP